MFSEIIEPLIPFFATVIGAFVSMLGILITLRINQKIHNENIKEERHKIIENREFLAKQDALMKAAESVSRFIIYYTTLADRSLPSDGTVDKETIEMTISLNRLHFYCSLDTIEKSIQLSKILESAVLEAIRAKLPSAFIIEELKVIDFQISFLEKMNIRTQEEIKAILQSGTKDPIMVNHRQHLADNSRLIADLQPKRLDLIKQKYIETEKCRDVINNNLKVIYETLRDVLLIARQELSFPINKERYREIIDNQIESTTNNLERMFKDIRKQIETKMQQ